MLLYKLMLAVLMITGQVRDATFGVPLSGVLVQFVGDSGTVETDAEGRFRIEGGRAGTVMFTRPGYDTVRIRVSGDTVLDVRMVLSPYRLDGLEVRALRADADAPITQSVTHRGEIQEIYSGQEVPALLEAVSPSITSYSEAGIPTGYSYFRLRGIDQTRINVTLDGVPLSEPEDQGVYFSNFPDFGNSIGSVQIQRGVGTSSNGVGSFAGGIHFEAASLATAAPTKELQVGMGAYGTKRVSLQGNTGLLGNGLAFYGRASGQTTDGYREHSGNTSGSFFGTGGYFGDQSMLRATVFYGREKSQMAYLPASFDEIRANPRANPLSPDEKDAFTQRFIALTHARSLGKHFRASATAYHIGLEGNYDVDIDGLWNFNLASHWEGLTSTLGYENGGTRVDLGGHAFAYTRRHWLHVRPDLKNELYRNSGERTEGSIFMKVGHEIGSVLLFGDAQVRHTTFTYNPSEGSGASADQVDWTFLNPKVGIRYKATPALSFYASLGRNQREPTRNDILAGFDDLDASNVDFVGDFTRVRPEKLTDTEFGFRYESRALSLEANAFWMQFSDEIAPIGELSYIGLPLRKNVDSSYRRGIEFDATWAVRPRWRTGLNATFMDAQIEEYTDDATGVTYRNVAPLLTPKVQSNHSIEWAMSDAIAWRLDGRYVGPSYLDNSQNHALTVPARYTVNTQVTAAHGPAELRFTINNLTNRQAFTGGQTDGITSFYFLEAPRHLMVSARYRF